MPRRCRVLALVSLLVVPLITGCGNGGSVDAPTDAESSSTTRAASASGSSTTVAMAGAGFDTTPVSTPPERYGLLARVAATADGLVDRVTFEFEGALPGYRVEYVERPLVQDGSGDEIQVDGEQVLLVHFEPASGFDLSGEGRQVYEGPQRLDLATRVVLDVVRVSDFEANLDWAIGVDEARARFRVSTADSPPRIIVEVEVPPAG